MGEFLELAKTRRSVRTFDGKLPKEAVLKELQAFAESITNPYSISIRFVFLDAKEHGLSSPVLSGERYYVTAVAKEQEHLEEAYGYSFQKLLMRAQELGLGTVWIGGTMPRDKFEKASGLSEGEVMPCISPLGVMAPKMSVKESMMRVGVKANSRMDFTELFFKGDFSTPLDEKEAEALGLQRALEAVRVAPSAVNKQPWRIVIDGNKAHFYEKQSKGYVTPHYDMQKIDLGIALYHFEAQLRSDGKEPVLRVANPGGDLPENTCYIATYTIS